MCSSDLHQRGLRSSSNDYMWQTLKLTHSWPETDTHTHFLSVCLFLIHTHSGTNSHTEKERGKRVAQRGRERIKQRLLCSTIHMLRVGGVCVRGGGRGGFHGSTDPSHLQKFRTCRNSCATIPNKRDTYTISKSFSLSPHYSTEAHA